MSPPEHQRGQEDGPVDAAQAARELPGRFAALIRPPRIQDDDQRSASRLELFFDLAFVLAVHQSADRLDKDLDWTGAAVSAGLITVVWWAWASSTLYANRFDTDDVVYRLSKLSGMAAVVVMAASASTATGEGAWRFALGYTVLRVLVVGQYARAWRHVPDAREVIRPYLFGHAASAVIWGVSIAVPGPARYVLWAIGVAIEFAAAPVAGGAGPSAPLHLEHLPERFALFVILVLGESVTAVMTGVQDGDWDAGTVGAAAPAFVIAVALWWLYFDLSGAAAKRRLLQEGTRSRFGVHDRYLFVHLPLAGGLVAVAVGLEHAITEAAEGGSSDGTRWTLVAGLVLYLAASMALHDLTENARGQLLWPGLGLPAVVLVGVFADGTAMLVLLAAVLVAGVVTGLATREVGELPTAEV